MWRPPPDDEVDGIRQEVRRARRRWNGYVVQRAAYGVVAVVAVAAALTLLLALVASSAAFIAALAGVALALIASACRLVAGAWRAWLGKARAPAWVDHRATMDGRLATLLELDGQPPAFFQPLLVESTLARRARFTPEEVVPSPVPGIALVAALVALGCVGMAVRLAPLLEPPPLAAVHGEGAGTASPPIDGLGSLFRRAIAAIASPAPPGSDASGAPGNAAVGTTGPAAEDRTGFAGLPGALQASIRRRLWGERWAHAGPGAPGSTRARAGAADQQRASRERRTNAAGDADDVRRATPSLDPGAEAPAAGTAAGAGTGSDPDLFGPATTPELVDEGRFALGLAARVRTVQSGPRPPTGDAPDALPDARPTLAVRQRPDEPAHRVTVPPAYAAIVRDAFAHRGHEGDVQP